MFRISDAILPETSKYWLKRARVPSRLLCVPADQSNRDADGSVLVDILVKDGRIAAVTTPGNPSFEEASFDLHGRIVLPTLIDAHVHLDKGQVIPRVNPDGTLDGGRLQTGNDRQHWSEEDIRRRFTFGLRCAYVHGVGAIRTHIDSYDPVLERSWNLFQSQKQEWAGKIELQAVSLVPIQMYLTDYSKRLADITAQFGGILGAATNDIDHTIPKTAEETDRGLDVLFTLAAERGLDVDMHVDQIGDLTAFSLPRIAKAVMRNGFKGRVTCDHCVNLALQPDDVIRETIQLCKDAGIAITTMPTPMIYLQDRAAGRTPRWRGVTLVHELTAAGIQVAIGGDNCRDAWFPYGDHDILDTFQQGVRIFHLDDNLNDALAMVGPIPASIMGLKGVGSISIGAPANLILFQARTLNEFICRPHAGRTVLNHGKRVTEQLPDYSELDANVPAVAATEPTPSAAAGM